MFNSLLEELTFGPVRSSPVRVLTKALIGNKIEDVVWFVFLLEDFSLDIWLYNCELLICHYLLECIMESKLKSFHYVNQRTTFTSEIEATIKKCSKFTIRLGSTFLLLHVYNDAEDAWCNGVIQRKQLGTSIFRNISNFARLIMNLISFTFLSEYQMTGNNLLTQFMLSKGSLTDPGVYVSSYESLNHLSLLNCAFSENNVLKLSESIACLTFMQHVNLSGNNICNRAAEFLSIAIDNNSYLQHLELANCFIQEEGLMSICNVIKNIVLLTLDLNCNFISEKVAAILVQSFTSGECIECFYLSKCSLNDNGLYVLINALNQIKSLKSNWT